MLKRVLIANRGEIALRVRRACREAGIETVSVYSQADAEALHVQLATRSVCIGPPRAADSYLNPTALLSAAIATGCDGLHPGYGFLSENPEFADACAENGITFIGPSGDAIRKAGSKSAARDLMRAAGVPVTPGSDGPVASVEDALAAAESVGYPVLLKASAGGGGRGIRRCDRPEDLSAAFAEAKAEAQACFGNDEMYLEKLVLRPRHIEFQVLADRYGNVIHLGDRDCSIQRRNQKLIEEAPARCLTPELREEMGRAAVKAAQAVRYEGAGTVEFLLDSDGQHFYFMEMNTRIQVEHGITEMITGVDLVRQQLRIASGLPLDLTQEDVTLTGNVHQTFKKDKDYINPSETTTGYVEKEGRLVAAPAVSPTAMKGFSDIWASAENVSHWDIGLAGSALIEKPENRDMVYKPTRLANSKVVPAMAGWQFYNHNGLMDIKGNVSGHSAFLSRFTDASELVCVTLLANKEGVDLTNLGRRIAAAFDSDKMGTGANDNLLYTYESQFSVPETMTRIEQTLHTMGVPVFAKFDHGKNAEEVGLQLLPNQVIVFGSPKVGTKLMQDNPSISIELPLKISVWEDKNGSVWATFPQMRTMAAEYGLEAEPVIGKMQELLEKIVIKGASVY